MNTLLIFFAFPLAVIIISAILQRLLHSPLAVAAFLIATLVYTILAFITATIVRLFCRHNGNNSICEALANLLNNNTDNNENTDAINNINNTLTEILDTINNTNNTNPNNGNSNNTCGCRYSRYRRF